MLHAAFLLGGWGSAVHAGKFLALSAAVAEPPFFLLCLADRSMRPVCRHFTMKGSCRYENKCAFYHPGVNGPPLP